MIITEKELSRRTLLTGLVVTALVIGAGRQGATMQVSARSGKSAIGVPIFQVDPEWPKLPNNWIMGDPASVTVDSHDNIWVFQRPRTLPVEKREHVAPPVLEFDKNGKFIRAWGGPSDKYEWPDNEHGINFNPDYLVDTPRPTLALWFGDNWQLANHLSITLGVRYDADWGASNPPWVTPTVIMINNGRESGDFGDKTGIRDLGNVAPRVGFADNVGGKNDLVIRGGSGIYYATPVSNATYSHQFYNRSVAAVFKPDGPGFMENPTRGASAEDFLTGRVPLPVQFAYPFATDFKNPYSWQSSIGFQKQLGAVMGVDVDLTALSERQQTRSGDVNLFYDPVTGYNLDPTVHGRPNPAYGQVQQLNSHGETNAVLLSSSFTRRFKNNVQGSVTYTRTLQKNDNTTGFGYLADNQFDPDADWSRSSDFQRDTLRANGIINLPWQMSAAASFFYGSGNYYNATSTMRPYSKPGTNRRNVGAPIAIPAAMLDRWDGPAVIATGTAWPRNALQGLALKKIDLRFTKRLTIFNNVRAELLGEVFNVFNWKNYGSYTTLITSARFAQPVATSATPTFPAPVSSESGSSSNRPS